MTWVEPKTNWESGHGVKSSDLNRIEGNINYAMLPKVFNLDGNMSKGDGVERNRVHLLSWLPFSLDNEFSERLVITLRQSTPVYAIGLPTINLHEDFSLFVGLLPGDFTFPNNRMILESNFSHINKLDLKISPIFNSDVVVMGDRFSSGAYVCVGISLRTTASYSAIGENAHISVTFAVVPHNVT